MKLVKYILDSKGNEIFAIPRGLVLDAIKTMAEKGVGALLVMENDQLVEFCLREITPKNHFKGKSSRETPVKDIMSENVVVAELTHTVEQCMELMTEKRIRHFRCRKGKVVGVLSIGDLVKAIIEEQKFTIEQLENYIAS